RPWASEFTIWFDKKKHQSKSQLDIKSKELDFTIIRPEGTSQKVFPFPSGQFFCYFSQIPDCLIASGYLQRIIEQKKTLLFIIVWENYPYGNEQYERIPNHPFSVASIEYDSKQKNHHMLQLHFSGQIIFYHFNSDYRFDK